MIFWLIILILLAIFPKNNNQFCKFFFILIGCLCAIRYQIGYDYVNYKNLIEGNYRYDIEFDRIEPLIKSLIVLCRNTDWTQLFFVITSIIIIGGITYFIKKESRDYKLSAFLFMCIPLFFWNSLSIIRQFVAITFALLMFMQIEKGYIKKSLLFYILAIMSHSSAILLGVVYFAKKITLSKVQYFTFFAISFLLFPAFKLILEFFINNGYFIEYAKYLGSEDLTGGKVLVYLFDLFFLLILFTIPRSSFDDTKFKYYFNIFFIGVFIYNAMSSVSVLASRLTTYFLVTLITILPYAINNSIIKQKMLLRALVYCILTYCYIHTINLAEVTYRMGLSEQNPYVPYKTVLFR